MRNSKARIDDYTGNLELWVPEEFEIDEDGNLVVYLYPYVDYIIDESGKLIVYTYDQDG